MAYLYDGIATTQKGSIIYKRKKHPMDFKDVLRIIKKLGHPRVIQEQYEFYLAAYEMTQLLQESPNSDVKDLSSTLSVAIKTHLETAEAFEEFGGGEFGGGGASGWFWELPLDVSDAVE